MMRSGLRNNSNECFINSALQCLAISPVIRDFIANYAKEDEKLIEVICKFKLGKFKADEINIECERILKEHLDILDASEKHILSKLAKQSESIFIYIAFKQMIINMNTNRGTVLNNSRFLSIIKEIADDSGFEHLFNGSQNDVYEFMMYIFNKLHDAKSTEVKIDLPANIEDMDEISKLYAKDYKSFFEKDFSYFAKNFYYYIVNCIECSSCKKQSLSVNINNIMALSIPTELDGGITIYDCLNTMFNTESIIYKCEKCGNIEKNLIEKKIISKPKSLIFAIKRYDNNRQKIKKMVQYPKIIDINNYYRGNANTTYELYGVILHSGDLNFGHYYAYIKDLKPDGTFDSQWTCCNDEKIYNITEEQALSAQSSAYMLLYH